MAGLNLLRKLKKFRGDNSGVAAVEFALFAPFLIGAVLVMAEVGTMSFDQMNLTSGVRSASQYLLTGGESEDVVKQLVIDGSGLDITAEHISYAAFCRCAVDDIEGSCNSLCSDDEAPRIYKTVSARVPDSGYNVSILGIYDVTIPDTTATAEVRTR